MHHGPGPGPLGEGQMGAEVSRVVRGPLQTGSKARERGCRRSARCGKVRLLTVLGQFVALSPWE